MLKRIKLISSHDHVLAEKKISNDIFFETKTFLFLSFGKNPTQAHN